MSLDVAQDKQPLTSLDQLTQFFRDAERPRSEFRVGLEHEKLINRVDSTNPVPYEGKNGIGALLERIETKGYRNFRESEERPTIALVRGQATISLEPGGQLELSGAPVFTATEAHVENLAHIAEVRSASSQLGLRAVALGYRPFGSVAQMPWMPKSRYAAMRKTLSPRGRLAQNMMLMTATGQVSLDWSDEADCIRKVVLAARLSPALVALFANSPLVEGQTSGYRSFRSHIWTEVDPARCGFLPSMFDGTFSYRSYADWALNAPVLFLRRRSIYLSPKASFGELLKNGFEGRPLFLADWVDHLSTLFPEVRIKRVMEVRGADCVSAELTGALVAFLRGIFYDGTAMGSAEKLLPRLDYQHHLEAMEAARRGGLQGRFGQHSLAQISKGLVQIAQQGLRTLGGGDEVLLEPLIALCQRRKSPAEDVLESWERKRDPVALLAQFSL